MKEMVDWLRSVEESASDLYLRAAELFTDDRELSSFLLGLGQDEARHAQLMGSASDFISRSPAPVVSVIKLDPLTIEHVEGPLRQANQLLWTGKLSPESIIEAVIKAESSEWGIIFVYTVNTLKILSKEFEQGASVIQSHKARIADFLDRHRYGRDCVDQIRRLPDVWERRFLVVEDQEPLLILLCDLLKGQGVVETARDGREGLEKTKTHFFDVIVSDIGMPRMNGLDFYREVAVQEPGIGRHFIFCSGEITAEHERFFRDNDLLYLRKPFALDNLMKMIERVLQQAAGDS